MNDNRTIIENAMRENPKAGYRTIAEITGIGVGICEREMRAIREAPVHSRTITAKGAVQFPASIEVSETHLRILDSASDEDIALTGQILRYVSNTLSWWVGDFLLGVRERKGDSFKLKGSEVAQDMAEAFGTQYDSAAAAMRVCEYVEPLKRFKGSTFAFHRVAIEECRDVYLGLEWVKRASEDGLSVSAMRAAIRSSRISAGAGSGSNSAILYDWKPFSDALSFAKKHEPKEFSEEDRLRILKNYKQLIAWIDELREITPHKESF